MDVEPDPGDALFAAPPAPPGPPLALYRRYRPDRFADMIGQEHVTEPLQRALVNNRVNHAYLFSGPRGCGKTTSARILARALNCENGPAAEPCGLCDSCQDLARGGPGSIDVIEIDAASHGGVDDARDLRERAFFAPVHSRYKIYIVDEAHMVTQAGFNALLKLVEEPPPHVKFIFATTEPDKVIGTIRSRTHHYPFRLVPPKVLTGYLATLCEAEGVAVDPAVLPLVVRAGAGSVRDSLSVLDQLLGGAAESGVSYAQATALLGFTPAALLDEIIDAFAAGDGAAVFGAVDKVIEVGQDPRRFAEDLLRRLRDLVIVAAVPDALGTGLIDVAGDQAERLQGQAARFGAGELARAAEVVATGLTDMRGTTAPRLYLELMCARILLPGADVDGRGVHARLDRLERRLGVDGGAEASAPAGVPPGTSARRPVAATVTKQPTAPPTSANTDRPVHPRSSESQHADPRHSAPSADAASTDSALAGSVPTDNAPGVPGPSGTRDPAVQPSNGALQGGVAQTPTRVESSPAIASSPEPLSPAGSLAESSDLGAAPTGLTAVDVRRLWPQVLEVVKSRRRFTWMLLSQNAQVLDVRDGHLELSIASVGARDNFISGGSEDILIDAMAEVLGASLDVRVIVDGGGGAQPPVPTRPDVPQSARSTLHGGRPGPRADGDAGMPAAAHRPRFSGADSAGAGSGGPESAGAGSGGPESAGAGSRGRESAGAGSGGPESGGPEQLGPSAHARLAVAAGVPAASHPRGNADGPMSRAVNQTSEVAAAPVASVDGGVPVTALRSEIRPMRSEMAVPRAAEPDDELGGADRDDREVDESAESHLDLLTRRLGAQVIDESES